MSLLLSSMIISVSCSTETKKPDPVELEHTLYSYAVQDSFYISVRLPDDYNKKEASFYPTVYLLDGNFHFPSLSAIVTQYIKAGLLPPMILVGIGYENLQKMDSLRVRDYMYPAAIPSDEMQAVGGGKKFDSFIREQLVPFIDSSYRTDETNRSLLGHSFGGYFTLYSLLNQLEDQKYTFKNIASISPSLWYNNFFLNQLPDRLAVRKDTNNLQIYLSVGGLENKEWNIDPLIQFGQRLKDKKTYQLVVESKIFGELDHMDVALISFIKSLQTFYREEE